MYMEIKIIGLEGIPLIKKGDDLSQLILKAMEKQGIQFFEGDILVIAETAIAKSEGNVINLKDIKPSPKALDMANTTGKDADLVEAILQRLDRTSLSLKPNTVLCAPMPVLMNQMWIKVWPNQYPPIQIPVPIK